MSALTGTAPLLRTTLKYEIRSFAPWIAIATALSASSVLIYPWLFPSQADRMGFAVAVGSNPAVGLVFGPAFDLSTTDGFNAWRSLALGGFLTALGAILAVVKATRGQEDSGQAELIASGVVGRSARLMTGVGVAMVGSLLVGLVSGLVTVLCGGGWQASVLLAATFTASGWMFAAVAAVTAQLGSDAHTASSMAVAFLGVLFVMRGFAYSIGAEEWTIWANPLGWMTQTRPATEDDWWPLLYALALTITLLIVAFAMQARRDFGQGAISPRRGPARGKLHSTWGLAVRLNVGRAGTWAVAFVLLGVVFAFVISALYVLVAGVLIAALASTADIGVGFGDVMIQAVATIPAVWTVVAVSVAVVGARPAVSLAAWVGVFASFGLTLLGPSFKLWDWALAISPFWHIPNVTDSDADWWGLFRISLVTVALLTVGFVGFRRRDIAR